MMTVQTFRERMAYKQTVFKTEALGIKQMGMWNGKPYPHILPEDAWSLNLWENISYNTVKQFAQHEIPWHPQKHNMLSSQIMCVNIFFPLQEHLHLINDWLRLCQFDVSEVTSLEFEYLGPKNYFNEDQQRGRDRTSADLAITWVDMARRNNLLLLEFKFSEPNFGVCSQDKNPNPQRCLAVRKVISSPKKQCHRAQTGRTYWDHILSEKTPFWLDSLALEWYCPFRYDFYQLMRNQLLAHCIQSDPKAGFDRAEFGVLYHADNDKLLKMSPPFDKEHNPLKAWPSLLHKPETFHTFSLQDFFSAIDPGLPFELADWREYLKQRYGI